jgi:restriction system protein
LLSNVKKSNPAFFERLVVDLSVRMGYGGTIKEPDKPLARQAMKA